MNLQVLQVAFIVTDILRKSKRKPLQNVLTLVDDWER